jgi:hypothetical protein
MDQYSDNVYVLGDEGRVLRKIETLQSEVAGLPSEISYVLTR